MDRKVKVCHIVINLEIGGAERLLQTLLKYIDLKQFELSVCCLRRKGAIGREVEAMGFDVAELNRHSCGLFDFLSTRKLYAFLKKTKPDIVHTHTFYPNYHGRIASFFAGIKVIISSEHGVYGWKSARHILPDRWLSSITDMIIAVSVAVKNFIIEKEGIDPGKVKVVYNAIDPSRFDSFKERKALRGTMNISEDDLVVGHIGRIEKRKGQGFLIEGFARYLKYNPKSYVIMLGDDPLGEKKELLSYAARLGMDSRIKFFDNSQTDVPSFLECIDIYVQPSRTEGFGLTAIEAMYMGKPVIASCVDGLPEVLDNGACGILVPYGDAEALASSIKQLSENKERLAALAAKGKERVLANYMPEKYARTIENIYLSLLEKKTHGN